MDTGRSCEPYKVCGKTTIRTIGGSWIGDPVKPEADTVVPVIVHDEQCEKPQHLRAEEAEQLLGYFRGATAGGGVTNKDRLRALGDGWDIRAAACINRFSSMAGAFLKGPPHPIEKAMTSAEVLITMLPFMEREGTNEDLVQQLSKLDGEGQHQVLRHMQAMKDAKTAAAVNYTGSVLDSGSGRHIQRTIQVTDEDNLQPLIGFDGSTAWTQGNGYLPAVLQDDRSGAEISHDFDDADKLGTVQCDILSLGKTLREGWSWHFISPTELYGIPPGSEARCKVEMDQDNILRLPHKLRQGSAQKVRGGAKLKLLLLELSLVPSHSHLFRMLRRYRIAPHSPANIIMSCSKTVMSLLSTIQTSVNLKSLSTPRIKALRPV